MRTILNIDDDVLPCRQKAGGTAAQEHRRGDFGPDMASTETRLHATADSKRSASAGGSRRRRASDAGAGEPAARRTAGTPELLDVNILIALRDPTHAQHDAAHDGFECLLVTERAYAVRGGQRGLHLNASECYR